MDFSTVFFRPIQMEDRAWMEQCAQLNPPVFTALTFPSLMTWASTYRLFIGGGKDVFFPPPLPFLIFFIPSL